MLSFNYKLRNPGLIIIILWLKTAKMVCISLVLLGSLFHALLNPGSRSRGCPYLGRGCAHSKGKRGIVKTWVHS